MLILYIYIIILFIKYIEKLIVNYNHNHKFLIILLLFSVFILLIFFNFVINFTKNFQKE